MKILFLTRRFWPEVGGVEKHVLEVGKRLVKLGHEVIVVAEANTSPRRSRGRCLATSEVFKSQDLADSAEPQRCLEVYQIPTGKDNWFKKFRIWKRLWRNRELIQQADIVHAHDVGFWYWPFRILYSSKPFFITFHGWEGRFPVPLKNKIFRKISEKLAWGNICVGDYLKRWYGTKRSHTTYGGVAFEVRGSRSEVKRKSKAIVFIGRLEEDTGLPIYLEAIQRYKDTKIQSCKVNFLGDGKLREEAEKYGQVLGFVKNIRPYILKSRFVFTSSYLAILEAMVCKRLVFAVYDNPLKKDYLKTAPFAKWIVIESDPKKLAQKAKYYSSHPEEERKLVDKAYDWAKKQSWEKVVSLYLKLWKT